ncbi:MAG: xanthine dehydrogenase family protein molybdopterin-binding subunit [Candidatus Rokubacteria bacterium]|nr:xanthine dehydrogenase family protein molybdopterin-binding subunit [Candidatus Rokubacteria bacterium]
MTATRVVGHSLPRMDAPGKVMGTAVYAADFALPGMLHARVLRAREPHARLVSVDARRAARLPGVRAVITAADVPDVRYGGAVKDETVFARDRIRFAGQPLAAVAATSLEAATDALAAIDVVTEPLPPILTVAEALAPGAPLVHEDWASYTALPILHREGNVANRARIVVGDVERGFAEADRVFEHRFTTSSVHQGYTEPRAAVAQWDSAGQVTVWSNTQLPFEIQSTLAEILQVLPSKVRVIVPGVGGGFGGKLRVGVEHFAALLARRTGRAVKVMTTSEEELTAAYARQPAIVELKTGVTKDGRLTAREGRLWFDTGAFAGSGPGVASVATLMLAGPYRIPNLLLEGRAVYTNKTNFGSFRAPSGPQANFAVESQMDVIADALGIDPLEFRLKNIVREGEEGPTGQVMAAVGLEECLLKAADAIGWTERRPAPGRGKGIACGWWTTTGGSSGVYIKVNPDGTVALNTGAAEIGTAALTGAAQVLAEDLGVSLADINVVSADTLSTPFDFGAQGSRTAFAVGNACRAAVAELKRQILALGAKHLGVEPDALALREGGVVVVGFDDGGAVDPRTGASAAAGGGAGARLTLAELARLSQASGGGLIAHGTFVAPPTAYDAKRVEGHVYPAFHSPSFHAHAVDLSVDAETGEVTIHRYVVAQDVGFAMNPTYIEGQIEGGVAQGLGQALSEEIVYDAGHVLNPNLTDYKMPTTLDVPRVQSILVQHPSLVGPFGAKGVGEPPNIEPPAAVANAVASATGVRITSLPITAEKIALARGGEAP